MSEDSADITNVSEDAPTTDTAAENIEDQADSAADTGVVDESVAPSTPPVPGVEEETGVRLDDNDDMETTTTHTAVVESDHSPAPVKEKKHKHKKNRDKEKESRKRKADSNLSEGEPEEPVLAADTDSDAEKDRRPPSEAEESDPDDALTAALKEMKGHRRRKEDPTETEQMIRTCLDFIDRMRNAAELDMAANADNEPALNKVKMLTEVVRMMQKVNYQNIMLEKGLFDTIRMWLMPLPDGSLPSLKIRETLLTALGQFPFTREALKISELGKVVMTIFQNKNENKHTRDLAQELINTWSREIFQLSTDFSRLRDSKKHKQPPRRIVPVDPMEEVLEGLRQNSNGTLKAGDIGYRRHARIPMPATMDYATAPESAISEKVTGKKTAKEKTQQAKLAKKMQGLRSHKAATRAVGVSIEGRTMRN